jgi:hypothetical protein
MDIDATETRTRATGKVTRLYLQKDVSYIVLDIPEDDSPKEGLFELRMSNANYNAQYSLALVAAANRWPLTIRVMGSITKDSYAAVSFLIVDWAASH